jgi:predicted  nucleic acid-binding Zn-ribbon protein
LVDLRARERIGSALQALASDLVTERRRVARLERENRQLREQVERLERELAATRKPRTRQRDGRANRS